MTLEYEGYAYLGTGVVLALVVAISFRVVRVFKGENDLNHNSLFYLICIILSIIVAVGPLITFGETQLLSIPVPDIFNRFFATFRSIGRFVWVAYYMIIVSIFKVLGNELDKIKNNSWRRLFSCFLIVIVTLQIIDFSPMINEKRGISDNDERWNSMMVSVRWDEISDSFDNVLVVTSARTSYPSQEYYSMCMYAYKNDMKLSSSYFAHMNEKLLKEISIGCFKEILEGKPRERVLYWFENEDYYVEASEKMHCEIIDGYYVGWVEYDR